MDFNMADEERQPTEREIKEQREKDSKVASETLKLAFWDYALPKLVTPEQYGQLSEMAKSKYDQLISKTPDQKIYERLFYPELAREGGAVTSPYLQEKSLAILMDAFQRSKVGTLLEYAGSKKELANKYKDKYVFELSEEERKEIIGKCITRTTNTKVAGLLEEANKGITASLEELLCEPEEPPRE
jgi:hypothetical protein